MIVKPTTHLYRNAWEALDAAFLAAGALSCGANRVHPSNREMKGRWGTGMWTSDPAKAHQIAEGLRLTGYEVVVIRGFSHGVVIVDAKGS